MITVNGKSTEEQPLAHLVGDRRGIAVAVNGVVVPRCELDAFVPRDGDVVEIVTAVQGG